MSRTLRFTPPRKPLNLGDKLHRLAMISPRDLLAIDALVTDLLIRRAPPTDGERVKRAVA